MGLEGEGGLAYKTHTLTFKSPAHEEVTLPSKEPKAQKE